MSLTARDAVTLTARTHGFDDVVTMRSGFVLTERPGAGGTTLTTASGRFESTTAGGAADMSTLTEMTSDCTCSYPTAGAVRIAGKLGKLSITATGDMARMDPDDDNDDDETEATKSATWDWLY
jgi:hypothetical protein